VTWKPGWPISQHCGRNLLDSGLREETVHVEHQQDVLTAWLADTHNQLVGVDFKGDTEAVSRESEDLVRDDELPGTRIEDPEPHLVEEERRRIVDQDLSGETERRVLSRKISEISSSRELGPVQFPQSLSLTTRSHSEIVGVRECQQPGTCLHEEKSGLALVTVVSRNSEPSVAP